ncbi:Uncharacterised protein [Achromobacter xylosoxidans]|nr:Uncharacterised protein [Achromobacter xylosoxidans]
MPPTACADGNQGEDDDFTQDRDAPGMAGGAAGAAGRRKAPDARQRRGGAPAAGAAMGAPGQVVPFRYGQRRRDARRPVPGAVAVARVSLHVRARLQGRLPLVFVDRRRFQRHRHAPGPPRRHAVGRVAGPAGEAAGLQAQDGLDVSLGLVRRERLQFRFQRLVHPGPAAGGRGVQLPPRRPGHATGHCRAAPGGVRDLGGHHRHRPAHLHAGTRGHERVRAAGRRDPPHLFHLFARHRCHLGHVRLARPRAQGPQRGRVVAAPAR